MNIQKADISKFYDRFWGRKRRKFDIAILRYREIERFVKKYIKKPAKILDLGCGDGYYTSKLSKFGEVTGIDFSLRTIQANRKRYPNVNFISGDVTDSKLNLGRFNLIVCSEVIEHINKDKQEQVIKNIYNLLLPDGYIIITTPNKKNILRLKKPHQSEEEFLLQFEGQPVANCLTEDELKSLMYPYFNISYVCSIWPCVKNRFLDLAWKFLFFPIKFLMVNKITKLFHIPGKYIIFIVQKR